VIEITVAVPRVTLQAVRDSKNPDGPALVIDRRVWTAFLSGIQAGQLLP
jgi:hypothetical protein